MSTNQTVSLATNSSLSSSSRDSADPYAGPAWNNTSEYPSLNSNEFAMDRTHIETLTERIDRAVQVIKPLMDKVLTNAPFEVGEREGLISALQGIYEIQDQANMLLWNLSTFVNTELSVDSTNVVAQKIQSQLTQLGSRLESAMKPVRIFLDRAPEEIITAYLAHPHTQPSEFSVRQSRKLRDTLLSEAEETLLTSLRPHGPRAFGNLYNQVSGTLKCRVETETGVQEMGLAQAAGLLRQSSEPLRRAAWNAIQEAWKSQEQTGAAILNGLAGWRLEVYKRRSHTRPVDFLDQPLHTNRISLQTLEAMLQAIQSEIEVPRRALRAIARGMNKDQVDPWDLLAPAPAHGGDGRRTFKEAMHLIRETFSNIDPSMRDFLDTMEKNRWIEGRILSTKRQGAYCTRFPKSRTPRVFQTYMGTIADIRTLAHELGHAYHGWVMRDLTLIQNSYPMTLAETASVFAETAFADHLLENGDPSARFEIAWQNAETAAGFLLNIPARFEFERNFYEQAKNGYVTPQELGDLMEAAWLKWYGNTISQADRQFWMSKLHFSISTTSFYNFPYAFGYLFSLGIYAQRAKQGPDFIKSYIALLRDTGRMTAEELVKTHLGEDITQPEFWKKSLAIVADQVAHFERMLLEREPARLRQ